MRLRVLELVVLLFSISVSTFSVSAWAKPFSEADFQSKLDQGAADYNQWCTNCHGSDGLGAGEFPKLFRCFRCNNERELTQYIQAKMPLGHRHDCVGECAESTAFYILNQIERQPEPQRLAKKVTIQRLNRRQYNYTVQDLLATQLSPADEFPSDDHSYGFDRIGDVLSVSPVQFELYLRSAQLLSDELFSVYLSELESKTIAGADFKYTTGGRMPQFFNLWSNGQVYTDFEVEHAGEYKLIALAGGRAAVGENPRMAFAYNNKLFDAIEVTADEFREYSVNVQLEKGTPKIALEFLNNYTDKEAGEDRNLYIKELRIEGPIFSAEQEQRSRELISCSDFDDKHSDCLKSLIDKFASKAWRRPLEQHELEGLIALYRSFPEATSKYMALKDVYTSILASPNFIFRQESKPQQDNEWLDHHEIASRLSYFIWDSMPDQALLDLANASQLHDREVIASEVQRMLLDEKSERMLNSFAGQWLFFNAMQEHEVNAQIFPEYTEALAEDLKRETELLFRDFMLSDQPFSKILKSNYSYLNQNLAQYYGIDGAFSEEFKRADLSSSDERFGLLSQGSILITTSHANRTSVVKRGKWLMSNLLCQEPPPPPPEVEGDLETIDDSLTLKEKMKLHASNAVCQSCHQSMDAIGFAFEHYNAIGLYREDDKGLPIDASGELSFGKSFKNAYELSLIVEDDQRFSACVVEKLYTYATSSGVTLNDKIFLKEISKEWKAKKHSWLELMQAIATSDGFLKQSPDVNSSGVIANARF